MANSRKVQLSAELDASPVKAGVAQVKDAIGGMARDVQASAQQAGKSFDDIPKKAQDAADKLDRSTRQMEASLQRTIAAAKAGGTGTAAYFETLAGQRGADVAKLQPLLAQLRELEKAQNAVGVSAGQTKAALRQLPAQFTDIFTSLQGGQAPLTVFLQQGGQIKDSFGGIGAAVRGIAASINPAVVALGAAGAAVVALGAAYKQGSSEADEYRRALVLTGNVAGTTVGQLQATAQAVAATVGTQGKAAEALAALAASGRVAGADLGKLAEAAIRLEREGGPAVEETVKQFAALGKDPLKAAISLNETTNFLTLSVYKQIKALTEQGNSFEAARVAQAAYADAGIERAKELERNLGTLERGWRGVKDAAKSAWDAILNIGRQDSLQDQLAAAEKKLQEVQASRTVGRNAGRRQSTFDAEEAGIRQQIETLRESIKLQGQAAQAAEARAKAVTGQIAADKKAEEAAKSANEETRRRAALLAELAGLDSSYADDLKRLQDLRRAGTLSEQRYVEAVEKLIQKQPFAREQEREREKTQRELTKALEEGTKAQAKYLDGLDKQLAGADADLEKMREEIALLQGGKAAREAVTQARLDDAAAQAAQNLQAAEARGAGIEEYERLSRLADKLAEVSAERRKLAGATADKEFADANAKAAEAAARDWDRAAESIRGALTDAFRRAFESGEDFGTAMAKVIGNELKARLATAVAGALADNVLSLAGLAANGQGGGSGGSTLSNVNNLATLYSTASKGYSFLTGGSAASSSSLSSQFVAGYKGSSAALGGAAGPVTDGAAGAVGAGATTGNSAAFISTWGAAIALGVYKANQDYSAGFRRDQAKDFSNSLGAGGYAFGGFESDMANALSKLGFSDRLADLLTGSTAVAALLGYSSPQIRNAGITGSITGGDFSGNATAQAVQQAGFVRKLFGGGDKVTDLTTALPDEIGRFLDAGAAGILQRAKEYGAALGLPVDALSTVSATISIKADEAGKLTQEALIGALGGYGDALVAGFADAVKPLAQYGETTVQTIERVGGAIQGTNEVLQALGLTALQASVDGGKAALALQALFGDIGTLQQAAGSYLQNYYTEAERANLATQGIARTLGDFGLQVPATRDAFRALVAAQDLTTESGQQAFAALMGVADAFATIVPAARSAADILAERTGLERELLALQGNTAELRARELAQLDPSNRALQEAIFALQDKQAADEAAAQASADAADAAREAADAQRGLASAYSTLVGSLGNGVRSAFSSVTSAIQGERQRLQQQASGQINALEQRAQRVQATFGGLIDSLGSAAATLTAQTSADGGRGAALGTLQQALDKLRQGKAVDIDAVKQAAGAVAKLGTDGFSSRVEYQRAVASSAGLLRDVQGAARTQMNRELASIARQQVAVERALDAQLAVLDSQLEEAQSAAGSLVSIDSGVQSVAEAIAQLAQAISAMQAAAGNASPQGQWLTSGGTQVWAARGGAVASRAVGAGYGDTFIKGLSGQVFTAADAVAFARDRIAAGDFAGLRDRAVREGIDSDALDALLELKPGTALEEARRRGLPGFETGTAYVPKTGVYVMHEGERVMTSADNAFLTQTIRSAQAGGTAADARLADLISAVRNMDGRVYAALAQVASNTRRTADTQEDWDTNGMPDVRPA